MPYYVRKTELFHHGVKGQQWGVKNGPPYPLSDKEKKKVSKQYKKTQVKAINQLRKVNNSMYKEVSKKTQTELDSRVNSGKSSFKNQEEYKKEYDKLFSQYEAQTMLNWYDSNELIAEGRKLVKDYDMTSWDDLAAQNEAIIKTMKNTAKG